MELYAFLFSIFESRIAINTVYRVTSLLGQYECKADAKGRINLPNALKNKIIPYIKDDFIIKRSAYQPCLELHPKEKFDDIMKALMNQPNKGRKFQEWLRRFTAGLKEVPIDEESGRLQIPKNLFDFAGLSKDVVLNASHHMIEIWDSEKYEAALLAMTDQEFEEMSELLFNEGGIQLP